MICLNLMDMRELRERAKLSPEEAAFRLEVAHSTIRNWESGKTEPSLGVTKVAELMKLYGCSFDELLQAVTETKAKGR
jgi:putative transcriptional regulator